MNAIRSRHERVIQTLWFEALGLAVVSPLFAQFAGTSMGELLVLLMVLLIAVMGWSALYNTAFDLITPDLSRREPYITELARHRVLLASWQYMPWNAMAQGHPVSMRLLARLQT